MKAQTCTARTTCPKTMAARLRTACAVKLLPLLLLLGLSAAVQAQFGYTVINGTLTITGYTGPGGAVTIPDAINGLPVTSIGGTAFESCTVLTSVTIPNSATNIGPAAFEYCYSLTNVMIGSSVISIGDLAFAYCFDLTSVTIGNGVTYIGTEAFAGCTRLTSITIPNSVTTIGDYAFDECYSLTSVTIPNSLTSIADWAFRHCESLPNVMIFNSVTTIGDSAFDSCYSLTSVTIPNSVTYIDDAAFKSCRNLTGIYFQGNAPRVGADVFDGDNYLTVYYMPETTGWGAFFADRSAVLWNPQMRTDDASFGVRTNQFGFTITGATNLVVVVEATTSLQYPKWVPVATKTLTDGSSYFSDPRWTNIPVRFYRLRLP
jgi:hypothetical protein